MQETKQDAIYEGNRTPKHAAKHAAEKPKKKYKKSKLPKILITIGIIIVLLFALVTAYAVNYKAVFPNTYVAGKNISQMTDAELAEFVTTTYSADKLKGSTLKLVCKDKTLDIKAEDLSIDFNHADYVQRIMTSGKTGTPILRGISFVSRFFCPVDVTPVISYNTEVLSKGFDDITADYEKDPVGYTFNIEKDSITIHNCIDGVKADRKKAETEFEDFACNMNLGTIVLDPVPVSPEPLNFDEFYKWLTSDVKDAYYEKVDGKVVVRQSKSKCEIEASVVKNAIDSLKSSGDKKITIPAKTYEPQNTTEKMTELLYKDKLGTYSTNFGSSSASRANNVRLATNRINGTELMPGEEFSYDKTILSRTSANGYMPAGVYVGNKSDVGMGGGICQPSSTLYAAALYANLEIVERHNHSLPVSYLPSGMDATIAEGYLDLRIKNNTNYPIKIVSSAEGGVCTFSIYGYNEKNITVDIERSSSGGIYYVTRVVKENGTEVKREKMSSSSYGTPEKSTSSEKPKQLTSDSSKKKESSDSPKSNSGNTAAPSTPAASTPAATPTPAPAQTPSAGSTAPTVAE